MVNIFDHPLASLFSVSGPTGAMMKNILEQLLLWRGQCYD
ncbi:hypothetical protein C789_196 [Microcystis aeruginosa FACHB-905 = DIANCHI905]|nr:hypothetical protein C789_196 [Microcystis aeruginosa FACHB-905 = DIANCHI905]